jgi:leucyl aminopeptidase
MQFEVYAKGLATLSVDCIVLGVFEDGEMPEEAGAIDSASSGLLKKLLTRGDFSGRSGETLLLTEVPGITASRALLTGLGARKSFSRKSWRRALGAALSAVLRTRIASIAVAIDRPPVKELDDYYFGRAIAEIVGTALYRVNDLKTGKKPKTPALQKVIAGPVRKGAAEDAERGLAH